MVKLPTEPIAVINPRFCAQEKITLTIKESMIALSGDDFKIVDQNNRVRFRFDSKAFSLNKSRVLLDENRKPVAKMSKKLLTLKSDTWNVNRADGQALFNVRKKAVSILPRAAVYIGKVQGKPDFTIWGRIIGKKFSIYDRAGHLLATVSKERPWHSKEALMKSFFNFNVYYVTVEAGVDMAFITTLCLLYDNMFNADDQLFPGSNLIL